MEKLTCSPENMEAFLFYSVDVHAIIWFCFQAKTPGAKVTKLAINEFHAGSAKVLCNFVKVHIIIGIK